MKREPKPLFDQAKLKAKKAASTPLRALMKQEAERMAERRRKARERAAALEGES